MMSNAHERAEWLMARGDSAKAQGQFAHACEMYREAAELEGEAFDRIPRDRPRTRGIIAISSVSLFRLAGDMTAAIRQARRFLTDGDLSHQAVRELEDLLAQSQAALSTPKSVP